jgi:hypothetical protein
MYADWLDLDIFFGFDIFQRLDLHSPCNNNDGTCELPSWHDGSA